MALTPRALRTLASGAFLVLVAALLGVWAAGGEATAVSRSGDAIDTPPASTQRPGALAAYAEIADRPLFTPARRPAAAPPPADVGPLPDGMPASGLMAVAIGPGRKAAVLKLKSGGTAVAMQGDPIDGWVLSAISPSGVILRRGASRAALSLPVPAGDGSPLANAQP